MTALEASQRAVLFMLESLAGGALPKRRRNRGAARRVKLARRSHAHNAANAAANAPALAHAYNKMVDARASTERA
jgi:hypothetical protein